MTPGKTVVYIMFGLLSLTFLLHFSYPKPSEEVIRLAHRNATEFGEASRALEKACTDFKLNRISKDQLQAAILKTRHAYKKIEFLLEYYYPDYIEEHINGAPLLHIERYDTRPFVLPPEGLQVLDELIFSAEAEEQKQQITILAQKLVNHTSILLAGFRQQKINDGEVIEAMRTELIRIFTLGVTGFDTPGSANALAEARTALLTLKSTAEPFLRIAGPRNSGDLLHQFDFAIGMLEATDFDTFDRLAFLREGINPLYLHLLTLRKELQPEAGLKEHSGRNTESTNLFAKNFLNPYFYTELSREEDSDKLRSLGMKLFYDPQLSRNNQMSCGSCHRPELAFSDGRDKSESNVAGQTVNRNAPTLLNAVYADRYFYDMRAFSLEQQAEHVIFNHHEFNTAYEEIVARLNSSKEYRHLFREALGSRKISRRDFSQALVSYVLSLQSFNSEFDQYVRGEKDTIAPKVKQGFNLFMGKAACGTCHFAPTFSGLVPPQYVKNESEILGVLKDPNIHEPDPDRGRLNNSIYSESAWIYERSFKTTTVRNTEVTAPYFHNGAYPTLESVVDFYDHGGGSGLGLQIINQTLPGDSLHLSGDEKEALVAFMKSLTDLSAGKTESPLSYR